MSLLFSEMGRLCNERGWHLEIAIYGGSALILDFSYRPASHDIDFHPLSGSPEQIKMLANEAACNLGMDQVLRESMRDDVSVFVSDCPDHLPHGDFGGACGQLRVFKASPQYILAMKVMSMRSSLETHDPFDVWNLLDACGIASEDEAVALVEKFYPDMKIPRRNLLILDDLLAAKSQRSPYSAMLGY